MKISKTLLTETGWKEDKTFEKSGLIQYKKTINDFHYTLSYMGIENNNWFDWDLHIDNPDFESVARMEVDNVEDIDMISKIYTNIH